MRSQPSGSPVSTAVSDILFAKSRLSFLAFSYIPPSLTWTVFSMECFPWIWRHSCSSAAPPPSLGSFPFCLAFQTLVLPRFHPPPLSLLSLYFLPRLLQREEVEVWHAAWESRTRQCGGKSGGSCLRSKLSYRQADPQACSDSRPSSRRPQGWRGAGGSWGQLRWCGTRESTSSVALRREGRNKLNLFWWSRPETGDACQIPYLQTQDWSVTRRATSEARRLGSSYVVPGLETQGTGQTEEPLSKGWDCGVQHT